MEEKMRALDANDTWDLVDSLRHYKLIGCKWVYKINYIATVPSTGTRPI